MRKLTKLISLALSLSMVLALIPAVPIKAADYVVEKVVTDSDFTLFMPNTSNVSITSDDYLNVYQDDDQYIKIVWIGFSKNDLGDDNINFEDNTTKVSVGDQEFKVYWGPSKNLDPDYLLEDSPSVNVYDVIRYGANVSAYPGCDYIDEWNSIPSIVDANEGDVDCYMLPVIIYTDGDTDIITDTDLSLTLTNHISTSKLDYDVNITIPVNPTSSSSSSNSGDCVITVDAENSYTLSLPATVSLSLVDKGNGMYNFSGNFSYGVKGNALGRLVIYPLIGGDGFSYDINEYSSTNIDNILNAPASYFGKQIETMNYFTTRKYYTDKYNNNKLGSYSGIYMKTRMPKFDFNNLNSSTYLTYNGSIFSSQDFNADFVNNLEKNMTFQLTFTYFNM